MTRKLPVGMQDFASIREDGYCYVDKTARIHGLIAGSGRAFFLSRPRRFGKTLLCSTLGAIFEGRRELFGEIAGMSALAIDALEWEWKRHPVIRLDLNPVDLSGGAVTLRLALHNMLENAAINLGLPLRGELVPDRFGNLILDAFRKHGEKAVVIIDEYDKPLLGTIDAPGVHAEIRDTLKTFYGVLKSSDPYLRFAFLTGVTKFSHVSIFSDLNHLDDISLDPDCADICGITQEELERDFGPEIGREEYLEEMRRFYNGYRFSKKPLAVYNPFGLLLHFKGHGEFLPYWYETGTSAFLLKLIVSQNINILDLNNRRIDYEMLSRFDIETMKAVPVLYQSGYLAITGYDSETSEFALDYPNVEVSGSFAKSLVQHCFQPSERYT